MRALFLSILWFVAVTGYAQKKDTVVRAWTFDITGGSILQNALSETTPTFKAPGYLRLRRPTEPDVANRWGLRNNEYVTDNPLGHGPMYIRPHFWYKPSLALELYASIEVDHRGASWGPYNTENIALLSRFHGRYDDWKDLKNGDSIRLFGKVGYFENYHAFEGLVLYNIDVQGLLAGVQYRKLAFIHQQTGDLVRGYGLGIDGMTSYRVEARGLRFTRSWKLDLKAGVQKVIGYPAAGGNEPLLHVSFAVHEGARRVYGELAHRYSDFPAGNKNALLFGLSDSLRHGKLTFKWRGEYRYYGGGFNYQFRNEAATHFRDVDRPAGANMIGPSVYPLSFYGRPFSQWAVFAEYDKPHVQGWSLSGNLAYGIGRHTELFTDFDLNGMMAYGESVFVYPFYNSGIKVYTLENTYMAISATNRTMNLDKHYTTYYYVSRPLLQLELKRTL